MRGSKSIAVFLPSLRGGGAERVTLLLIQGFVERGFSVDLILAQAEGPYLKYLPSGVHLVNLGVSRTSFALHGLVRYLKLLRPHVLLSALDHANVVAIIARHIARTGTRLVVSVHAPLSLVNTYASNMRGRLVPRLVRKLYPLADEVVAVSQGVAKDLIYHWGCDKANLRVIYNPVLTPDLIRKSSIPLNHPWFQPGAPPVILSVGRLSREKDFPTLLRAFALVKQEISAQLMILGEGRDRPLLEQIVKQLNLHGAVAMPGFVENPYPYMRHANLFVLSSLWEGFGLVLVEAMACGTPVVSTDCPTGPYEILEGGKWGKLVPVGNPQVLAEAILDTLRNPTQFDPTVRAADFSLERAVEAYLDVLDVL